MVRYTPKPDYLMEDTYHDYWSNVEHICNLALEAAKGRAQDADEAQEIVRDYITQSVDGDRWVIYTPAASRGLIYSDNRDEFFINSHDSSGWDSYSDALCQMMFCALEADVWERMPDDWQEQIEEHFMDNPTPTTKEPHG